MAAPLYGLVLAGGKSTRMGEDKAALDYHGRPQAAHALDLLATACAKVFLSCRADQAGLPAYAGHPRIHDAHIGLGPLGGILSALDAHPEAAFLVAACDLPFLDRAAVAALAAGRDPEALATAFEGPLPAGTRKSAHVHDPDHASASVRAPRGPALPDLSLGPSGRLPEPLFAIYEPAMRPRMLELLDQGIDCPRKAIVKSSCRILPAPDPRFLANVNDPEDLRKAKEGLPPRA